MNLILLFISFFVVFCLIMTGYTIAIGSTLGSILLILAAFLSMGIGFIIKRKVKNVTAGSE